MNNKKPADIPEALFNAIESDQISRVHELIEKGDDINARDKGGSTPLMRSALHGYIELLALLLGSGADVTLSDKTGKTALHYAAQEQHEDVVRRLLEAGADVNAQDIYGNSPLSNAVFYSKGRGAVIKILRQNGADETLPNKHGVTPIGLAKNIANFDIMQHFADETT
jgi:ankyrin repeat protein